MRVWIVRHANAQSVDRWDQFFAQTIGGVFANRHDHGQRHAALASGTEGCACQIVDYLIQIGIRHYDAVVLRATKCLNPLRIRAAA